MDGQGWFHYPLFPGRVGPSCLPVPCPSLPEPSA
ncbi:unnamed protein product [Gulo gulo]|uniref:Uncharacterized protein n=1 Tax=Gulo gulo TaxID=48420 RepID=A0A9X9LU18_GULGU|nr:unnamed protein product [Gulo gulo]